MKYTVFLITMLCIISLNSFATTVSFAVKNLCNGDETEFNSTSFSKDSILHFNWDLDGDGQFNDDLGKTVTKKFSSEGVYSVGLQIVTDVGDTMSMHKNIEIFPNPFAGFTTTALCSMDSTEFTTTSTLSKGKITNYFWDFGDGERAIFNVNPKHKYGKSSTYSINLLIVSDKGCKDSVRKNVTIRKTPEIVFDFRDDTIFYEGKNVIISLKGNYPTILWSTGESSDSIIVDESKTISVNVTDFYNCSNSASVLITVLPKLELNPIEILTPNGDGKNDYWIIEDMGGYKQITVNVYNKYGDEVYSSESYSNDWQGDFNGNPLPEGSYYYIIKIIDNNKIYKGTLTILR